MNGKFLLIAALFLVGCGPISESGSPVEDYEGWAADGAGSESALRVSQRVFVTSTMHAPSFGDIYGADEICAAHASAAKLGGRWKAWVSSSTLAAPTRMLGQGPWTLVDGNTVVFTSRKGDFLAPVHPIDRDELGHSVATRAPVWTGTSHLGEPSTACVNWSAENESAMGEVGEIGGKGTTWTDAASVPCVGGAYLYCFEQL